MQQHPALGQPSIQSCARLRATVLRAVRDWFHTHDFLEVDTPSIVPCPGMEPHLDAFAVPAQHATLPGPRWLHTSPEYAIKATFGALDTHVFTLARCYRDEPTTRWHYPEFTMLEWYRRDASFEDLMVDTEALIRHILHAVAAPLPLPLHGAEPIAWDAPFDRRTVAQAVHDVTGLDALPETDAELATCLRALGLDVGHDWDWESAFTVLYTDLIEPHIGWPRPTFLTHYPARLAALARRTPTDPTCAERFELYLPGTWDRSPYRGGIEIANAFSELIDPVEQRARFEDEAKLRARLGRAVYPMPEPLLRGLSSMPETAGIALGVERLLVWLAETVFGERAQVSDFLLGCA